MTTQAELQGKVAALESMSMRAFTEQDRRSRCEDELRRLTEEKKVCVRELDAHTLHTVGLFIDTQRKVFESSRSSEACSTSSH